MELSVTVGTQALALTDLIQDRLPATFFVHP